jgi:hypothetical protein
VETGEDLVARKNSDENHYAAAKKLLSDAALKLSALQPEDADLLAQKEERVRRNGELAAKLASLASERDAKKQKLFDAEKQRIAEQKRLAEETARRKKQEELRQKRLAEERKREAQVLAAYRKRLAAYQEELRNTVAFSVLNKNFADLEQKLVLPNWYRDDSARRSANAAFQRWLDNAKKFASELRSAWELIYDTREAFADFQMMSPVSGKTMKIRRIKKGYILLYQENMMSENLPFIRFSAKELRALGSHAAQQKGLSVSPCAFYVSVGKWAEAGKSAAPGFEKTEIPGMMKKYFQAASDDAVAKWRSGSRREAEQLFAAYGSMPEFADFKTEIRKRLAELKTETSTGKGRK